MSSSEDRPGEPEPERHHRRRRRSSHQEPSRRVRGPSLLSRLGRRLSRRGKLVVCATLLVVALALSIGAHRLELTEATSHDSFVSAVGLGPALFVTVLAVGVLVLAQAIGYKRKRLWMTTTALIVYLLLHALAWHHAYSMAHDALEPQVPISLDDPTPPTPAVRYGIDLYVMGLYTVGALSTLSTLLLMRTLIHWSTPSEETRRRRASTHSGPPEPHPEPPRADLLEPKDVELSTLDEPASSRMPPASKHAPSAGDEEPAPPSPPKRRTQRLFE